MKKTVKISLLLAMIFACVFARAEVELPGSLKTIDSYAFYQDVAFEGVVEIPQGVTAVGAYAFAYTDVYGLKVPAAVTSVGDHVLKGADAAYIELASYRTLSAGVLEDVAFVFVNSGMSASISGKYINKNSVLAYDGLYYLEKNDGFSALCPVDRSQLGSQVKIPQAIGGKAVNDLSMLAMPGCEDVTIYMPCYLSVPAGLNNPIIGQSFLTVGVSAVSGQLEVGSEIKFTATAENAIGTVTYSYEIINPLGARTYCGPTADANVYFVPDLGGLHFMLVTAEDAVGQTAEATMSFMVSGGQNPVTCRALLIGNTYPNSSSQLDGPDNDANAMNTMLGLYTGSNFKNTVRIDVTASEMLASISTAFAGADYNDISLFYFSGHGSTNGSLCGTGSSYYYLTYVGIDELRQALDKVPGTKIVLLDCCHSGAHIDKSAGARAVTGANAFNAAVIAAFSSAPAAANAPETGVLYSVSKGNLATNGYVVITACSQYETSSSLGTGGFWFGLFTHGLCLGSGYNMRNDSFVEAEADVNGDDAITVAEAYNAIEETVNLYKDSLGITQNTQYYGDSSFVLWFK